MSPLANFLLMQVCLISIVLLLHCYIGLHIIRRGIIFSDLVLDQLAAVGTMAGIRHRGALRHPDVLFALHGLCPDRVLPAGGA